MMEKEPQPESMATVTIKPEYPPSEYSEAPPVSFQYIFLHKTTATGIEKSESVTVEQQQQLFNRPLKRKIVFLLLIVVIPCEIAIIIINKLLLLVFSIVMFV